MNVIILLETGKGIFSLGLAIPLVRYDIRKRNFVLLVVVRRKRLPRSMVIYGREYDDMVCRYDEKGR